MNNELYHHGIKGMHWGIRRTKAQLGYRESSATKKKTSIFDSLKRNKNKKSNTDNFSKKSKSKNNDKKKPKKKKISEMTDDELKAKINRMNLEADYKKAISSSHNKSNARKAMDFVAKVSGKAADDIGTQLATYLLGTGVNKVAKDVFGVTNKRIDLKDKNGNTLIDDNGLARVAYEFENIVNPKGRKK